MASAIARVPALPTVVLRLRLSDVREELQSREAATEMIAARETVPGPWRVVGLVEGEQRGKRLLRHN